MSWTGRRLNSITNSGVSNSYLYDANGIRTRKTVGSTVTEYFTNGSTILAEKTGSNVLWYIYDSDGEILGFIYNGTPYYYVKNVQGDVLRIVDAEGTNRATYRYDPWGKILQAAGGIIAYANPIRYRSYYYDKETSLYYLNSRYYDPETGRFLNADDVDYLGESGTTLSYNLFAYCENNFINMGDYSGEFFGSLVATFTTGSIFNAIASSLLAVASTIPVAGWIAISVTILAVGAVSIYKTYYANKSTKRPKSVNLPSYKSVKIDMLHIISGHTPGGNRGGPRKDRFPGWMKFAAIERAIREAYRFGERIRTQGDRVFLRGPWGNNTIEMWVNTVTKVIKSAWPKYK